MIPLPVESRWNYEVSTIRCFLRISQDDMASILAIKNILEPFEALNEKLQGENFCTISMVAPAIFELEAHLEYCIKDSSSVKNSGN